MEEQSHAHGISEHSRFPYVMKGMATPGYIGPSLCVSCMHDLKVESEGTTNDEDGCNCVLMYEYLSSIKHRERIINATRGINIVLYYSRTTWSTWSPDFLKTARSSFHSPEYDICVGRELRQCISGGHDRNWTFYEAPFETFGPCG